MQPSPPPGVSSRTPPQFEQVEICCDGGCICFGYAARLFRPDRGNDCSILRSIPCLISRDISSYLKPKVFDNPGGGLLSRTKLATKRFPSPRCASAIQIVRPLEPIAETQPQLQPASLRLSAMISQYFILCRARAGPFGRTALVELYRFFGTSEATIFSKRGSPRSGSHVGCNLRSP